MDCEKALAKMKKLSIATCQNWAFSQLTTLGCGGTIELTIFPDSIKKMVQAVRYLCKNKIPFCIVGRGSNILASDDHYNGVVIVTKQLDQLNVQGNTITASCGVTVAKLAKICCANGLSGGEFLCCLPASVGGIVVCNAGCFGQCASDVVQSVTVLVDGKVKTLSNSQCCFSHRNSLFKNNNSCVILQVKFAFTKGDVQQISHKMQQMKAQKSKTQPLGSKSAGCVLYHPQVVVSALIDQAGLKGYTVGRAKVSKKHAGFVVNIDKATAYDIYLLVRQLQIILHTKYNVDAQVELCLVNFSENTNDIFPKHQN